MGWLRGEELGMCMFKTHCIYKGNYQKIKVVFIAKAGFGLLILLTPTLKCLGYGMCHHAQCFRKSNLCLRCHLSILHESVISACTQEVPHYSLTLQIYNQRAKCFERNKYKRASSVFYGVKCYPTLAQRLKKKKKNN